MDSNREGIMGIKAALGCILLSLTLAGCGGMNREKMAARADADCQSYGAKPGSSEYFQCRMMRDQQDRAENLAIAEHNRRVLRDFNQSVQNNNTIDYSIPPMAPIGRTGLPSQCISRPSAGTVMTQCY
jgi:hypothetical protein